MFRNSSLLGRIAHCCTFVAIYCLTLAALNQSRLFGQQVRGPNIVFILADDLGWKDLSNEGSTFYESPNIDRLADSGAKFTRGYAACQVCSPSRASILTGKYPPKHGITTWIGDASGTKWTTARKTMLAPPEYDQQLRADETTLAEVLKANGYRTFFAGKWHLGGEASAPTDHGFEFNRGGFAAGSPPNGYFAPYKNPALPDGPDGESLPLRLGRETADFIAEHRDESFFAFLSFYSVHSPIQTTKSLWKKYRDKADALGLIENDARFLFDRRLNVRQSQDCPIYAGMIESMDAAVGLVLNQLDASGLADNTIVCFTSDNGGVASGDASSTSNLPLRGGKGRQWEGGIREPFYVRAPGVSTAGSTIDVPVSGIDWYPTLLELAGLQTPAQQAIDGVSLKPLLQGGKLADRPLFWHYPHYGNQGGDPSSIILQNNWKLIHYHEDGHDELYHVIDDIGEQDDVLQSNVDLASDLRRQLDVWLKSVHANFPTRNPNFDADEQEASFATAKTQGLKRLSEQHAKYLDKDFSPNKNWWGSQPND